MSENKKKLNAKNLYSFVVSCRYSLYIPFKLPKLYFLCFTFFRVLCFGPLFLVKCKQEVRAKHFDWNQQRNFFRCSFLLCLAYLLLSRLLFRIDVPVCVVFHGQPKQQKISETPSSSPATTKTYNWHNAYAAPIFFNFFFSIVVNMSRLQLYSYAIHVDLKLYM